MSSLIAPAEPLTVDATSAAALLGIGLRTFRRMNSAGQIPAAVRIGGAIRWRRDELAAWLAADCPDRATWERLKRDR